MMKALGAIAVCICLLPALGRADPLNLATLSCETYENEVLPASLSNPVADNINTVMWLFGYSVAKGGAHVMYADALAPFGFALDSECKANPKETLLTALAIVRPQTNSPLDLSTVECAAFASRHVPLTKSDPESATTVMMWLFGFSVAKSGGHQFDADGLTPFETSLLDECSKHPKRSLFEVLAAKRASPRDRT